MTTFAMTLPIEGGNLVSSVRDDVDRDGNPVRWLRLSRTYDGGRDEAELVVVNVVDLPTMLTILTMTQAMLDEE